jgi:uncharacterized protein involved in response to NO
MAGATDCEGKGDGMAQASAEARRGWTGPAVLSHGFRPFFLGGALWAAAAMALWIGTLSGAIHPPARLAPLDWHVHALLYGFLPAILAGFLLTAIPNWTGRLPVVGWRLLALFCLWLAGRVATTVAAILPAGAAEAVDLAFLLALALLAGREIVAGRNWRNLIVLAAVGLLWVGNLVFHLEAAGGAAASGYGARIGVAVGVFLILLIGGRIVPSFTRNWLARRPTGRLPAPPDWRDAFALGLGGAALALWVAAPNAPAAAILCLAAGLAHLLRLARWAGFRTFAEPLVSVLHAGYLFAPLGFLAVAAAALAPGWIGASAALHAWTAGAVGVMTLAVMTRASLGHSGRALAASPATVGIYAAAVLGALLRVAAGVDGAPVWLADLSAVLWVLAFGGFALAYWPVLTQPRLAPKRPQPRAA